MPILQLWSAIAALLSLLIDWKIVLKTETKLKQRRLAVPFFRHPMQFPHLGNAALRGEMRRFVKNDSERLRRSTYVFHSGNYHAQKAWRDRFHYPRNLVQLSKDSQ